MVVAIGETLIHEVGHYFGLSEEEIEEIEERYWRGEGDDDEDEDGRRRRSETTKRRPEVAASSAAQAIRAALSRAGVGGESRRRDRPAPGDVFLEIGPGTGALTLPLAATGAPVLAVEIDRDLVADAGAPGAGQRHDHVGRHPAD